MPSRFDTALARMNQVVFDHLKSGDVLLDGVLVDGIFTDAYATGNVGMLGMDTTKPTLSLPTTQVPANPYGKPVVVDGKNFVVGQHEPDGSGGSVLMLEAA